MALHTKTIDVCGDTLDVIWDGNVWVSPSNGQQHSHSRDAMRVELKLYFDACGEPDDDETAYAIESVLDNQGE